MPEAPWPARCVHAARWLSTLLSAEKRRVAGYQLMALDSKARLLPVTPTMHVYSRHRKVWKATDIQAFIDDQPQAVRARMTSTLNRCVQLCAEPCHSSGMATIAADTVQTSTSCWQKQLLAKATAGKSNVPLPAALGTSLLTSAGYQA